MAALVFVTLDKVPAQNEVFSNVIHAIALQAHGHIMPGHAAVIDFADFVTLPIRYALEVHDTVVVEILSREDVIAQTCWVNISQWVLVCIPPSKAKINASDEGHVIVNHDEFFVVSLIAVNFEVPDSVISLHTQ